MHSSTAKPVEVKKNQTFGKSFTLKAKMVGCTS